MDNDQFFQSLKPDDDKNTEYMAGAEHLVRLRQQTGFSKRSDEDLQEDLSKLAFAGYENNELQGKLEDSPIMDRGIQAKLRARYLEKCSSIVDKAKDIDPVIAALVATGGLVGGVGTYLNSKPRDNLGGKSKSEILADKAVAGNKATPEGGLISKMRRGNDELSQSYAKAFKEHPIKASLLGSILGGATGYSVARAGGATLKALKGVTK